MHIQRYDVAVEKLLTVADIAEALKIEPVTVRSYASRGQMPAPDVRYGSTPLWKPETLAKWRPSARFS